MPEPFQLLRLVVVTKVTCPFNRLGNVVDMLMDIVALPIPFMNPVFSKDIPTFCCSFILNPIPALYSVSWSVLHLYLRSKTRVSVALGGLARHDPVHVDAGRDDGLGVEGARLHDLVHLSDGDPPRGGDGGVEVAGGAPVDQVP